MCLSTCVVGFHQVGKPGGQRVSLAAIAEVLFDTAEFRKLGEDH